MQKRITFFNLFLFAAAGVLHATPDPFSKAFDNPVDKLGLPRVLIIGDSISIGYTPRVRKILDGRANVHRPKTNCKWSAFGDQKINEWIGNEKWDLIHFNFGLWDWYGWSQDTKATPRSYSKSLDNIVQNLTVGGGGGAGSRGGGLRLRRSVYEELAQALHTGDSGGSRRRDPRQKN